MLPEKAEFADWHRVGPTERNSSTGVDMRILPIVFIVAAVIGLNGPVLAQQAPGPEDLKASLVLDLPAYWRVDMVEIQASVNDGDEISPQFRQRFTADVASREDLYLLVDEVEAFNVVAAVTPARMSYRLYGIGFSKLEKGRWSTRLEMENSLRALGQPQSMFDGPVLVAGGEASQQAIEAFMQGRETAKALAERATRTAANADVLARLAAEADAQERALLEDSYRRRLEALKGRIDADLAGIASAVDAMVADNRKTLAQLEALNKDKVAAARASAETQFAIAETKEEAAAQDELAAALEALAAKRQRSAELEAQAVEAQVAASKKRYDLLSSKLASADPSEQLAAFDAAMSSDDENLRRLAFSAAFRSANDDVQGAALAAYVSGMPQMSISVAFKDGDGKAGTYIQILRITEVSGASFAGEISTPGWGGIAKGSGTIQGDTLSLSAQWESEEKCSWRARVNEQGILGGQMQCAGSYSRPSGHNPGGDASVSF